MLSGGADLKSLRLPPFLTSSLSTHSHKQHYAPVPDFLSAIVGVTVVICFGAHSWYAPGLAVATVIALMTVTGTLHPPGGATALIAVIGSPSILALGYWYVLVPVALGAVILLAVALLANNFWPSRRYPLYW